MWLKVIEQKPPVHQEVLVAYKEKIYLGYFSATESWLMKDKEKTYEKNFFFTVSLYCKTDPDDCGCEEFEQSLQAISLPFNEIIYWQPLPELPNEC